MVDIVRAGALWGYRQLVQSLGGDPDRLLSGVGLTARDLSDFDRYISRLAVIDLYEQTAKALSCPDFGLQLAAMRDVNVLGALAFAIRHAADLRSALESGSNYLHYHAPTPTLTIEPAGGGRQRLVCRSHHAGPRVATQYVEHGVGLIVRIIASLTDRRAKPRGVEFAHAPVAALKVYEAHLGLTPVFEADDNAVVLTERDLRAPLKDANRQLQSIVERYLDAHSPQPGRYADQQTRQALSRLMRQGPAGIADVAEALRIHPRTLQRKLKARGTTFEQVRDEVRRDLAEVYLAHDVIPISHVADLLGYADQSVLTRSCLRWFGRTPLQMRQQLTAA